MRRSLARLWPLLLFAVAGIAVGQVRPSDIKFRLAQSYERAGDLETAVQVLREIAVQDSFNIVVNDALRRDLVQLKRYDEALGIADRMLRRSPSDLSLLSEKGTILFLKSDRDGAMAVWQHALAIGPKNESTYRIVGGAMVQNRLFDQAVEVYLRGRKELNDPLLFTIDVGYLYGITLNYAAATREFLTLLRQNPGQMMFVQSRIALYTAQSDALALTTGVVEEAAAKEQGVMAFRQLLAWLYLEGKQFGKAYEIYRDIDRISKAEGHELQRFAERAANEHAYLVAATAFREILAEHPSFDKAAEVKFGYAHALEASAAGETDSLKVFGLRSPFAGRPDTGASRHLEEAIHAYERVINDHPGADLAARSLLRIGIIRQDSYGDLDGARQRYEQLLRQFSRYPVICAEARFRLGDVRLTQGDCTAAAEEFRSLSTAGFGSGEFAGRAVLRLAEINYFTAQFDSSLALLRGLESNPLSDVANDAIGLQILIQGNRKPNDSALVQFAAADLLRRQNRLSESVVRFESILKAFPGADITDETLSVIGDVYAAMNLFPQAIAAYDSLLANFPESIENDRTLMKKGSIYQFGLRDRLKAAEAYEALLEKYPASIYSGEARKRIRLLRGEAS
jgi:cellulose synthase operon protein C